MKSRDERQRVMVKARMRSGASWNDVCILNLSLHGLGIQTAEPPSRGTYVEIRKGTQSIVARVIWAKGYRAGLLSQDAIFISALLKDSAAVSTSQRPPLADRRRAPRSARQRHEGSRFAGRTMEFTCLAIFAGVLAIAGFGAVEQALAAPFAQIKSAL